MKLPIEVASINPTRFRWRQLVESVNGPRVVNYKGSVQASMEQALLDLVSICKQQQKEIKALRKQVKGHCDRIAAQSELLSKKAEAPAQPAQQDKKGKK